MLVVVVVVNGSTTYTTTVELFIVDDDDDDDEEEEEDDEKKNCFKITQNLLYCSLGYIYKYICTPKFFVKVLWVYSHLK